MALHLRSESPEKTKNGMVHRLSRVAPGKESPEFEPFWDGVVGGFWQENRQVVEERTAR